MLNNKKYWVFALVLLMFAFTNFVSAQVNPNSEVENKVRASFTDMPAMIGIAKCESGYRQFSADGSPLRGGSGKHYIGIFQIDENIHAAKAKDMAFDIYTIDGNIAYARYMFFKSGTNPWKGCLTGSTIQTPTVPVTSPTPVPTQIPAQQTINITGSISVNLSMGMSNSQIQ
ncbi:MAG: hypothetical protein KW793_03080 [Candidatus Doudnabacteria bacterium]|nr:hypothetical protein [Candidatus Doudnabacteria bacterium]